jgi:hypothetical protein
MEALTRLVADSLARHGLDRPVDPRRLQWSRWFRCDSPHSLLIVPSKPGIFACAEEILGGAALQRCDPSANSDSALAAEEERRLLAVLQFSEDDDMAFTLDRMFTVANPMRARLVSGSCFLRFVVIEDPDQRRTICAALNQWVRSSAEKASGLPSGFSSSLELASASESVRVGRTLLSDSVDAGKNHVGRTPLSDSAASAVKSTTKTTSVLGTDLALAPQLDSGANSNRHCPQPFPSGF